MAGMVLILSFCFGHTIFITIGIFFTLLMLTLRRVHPLQSLSDRAQESYGEVVFPLGVAVTAALSQTTEIFMISVAVLGIADTAAYIVGHTVQSKKLVFEKTIAGSGACFICSLLLLLAVAAPIPAIITSITITLAELVSSRGYDNASIPIVASLLLTLVF